MTFKEFSEKIARLSKEGLLSKLLVIIVAAAISLSPFISIQKDLRKSLGNQPKMLAVIYFSTFLMILIIVLAVLKTRHKNKN